ncbi:MAG: RNA-directed DNA polymerase, partial [Bacteroidaceae bacterium]|nr:RNA-directed DNA polymerase [Bacteroidaceae bacterium]
TFTADTYACIKGRGIHSLLQKIRKDLREDPAGTRYCLKLDVRKFYPSIDHDTLKMVVRKKIKDPDVLWLLDDIIDSAEGVPIGNYISQFFANLYLSELDHQIKEFIGLRYYYRYADDIVVLSDSKQYLSGVLVFINDYLNNERLLDIKRNYQIFPVDVRGIDFVGYVIYHTHCLARKRNKKGLCREVAKLRKKGLTNEEIRLRVASRLGFMVHCDSKHLINILGMKKFSDIKPKQGKLTGSKYHIDDILNREIHLTAFEISQSKYDGDMLTLQYEIYEQMEDEQGKVIDDDGQPVMAWIKHITFTGSKALMRQLDGVELTEPVAAKIIKQPIGTDGRRCFYSIVDPDQ